MLKPRATGQIQTSGTALCPQFIILRSNFSLLPPPSLPRHPLSPVPDPPMTPPEKANFLQASLQVWRLIPKTTCPCPSPVISQNYSCSKSPTVSAIPPNAPARKVSLPTNCAAALLPSAALAHPVSMPSRPSPIPPNAPSPGSAVSSASPLPMARPPSFPTPSP